MVAASNRQILLVQVPEGKLRPEHFALRQAEIPTARDGDVTLRVRYLSLDAASRAWMHGATYRDAVVAGSVMAGAAVARRVGGQTPGFWAGGPRFFRHGRQRSARLPGPPADPPAP